MDNLYAVILAGGKGERFWPLSTSRTPKQLLRLVGDRPLLAQAVDRLEGLIPPERVRVITNADLVEATCAAVPELAPAHVVGEPVGRDTAAAVALACALVKREDPGAVFCVLTADHIIGDLTLFRDTLAACADQAREQEVLVTIGLRPTFASTGFGYIEAGNNATSQRKVAFSHVRGFVEKPDLATAESYLARGTFFWNSGMFVWSVPALEKALRAYAPQLSPLLDAVAAGAQPLERILAEHYPPLERISIDYAVMEKADNILTAVGTFAWDDVGSWTALENHFEADAHGNICLGQVEGIEASDNIVVSGDRLTALVGVHDLIVVQAGAATLVCHRDRAQEIKAMVAQLKEAGSYQDLL